MVIQLVQPNGSSEIRLATYEPRFGVPAMSIICVLLGVIIVWTIVGNVFVMVTIVTELNVKNSSNHLIFSLAATDLLVASAVMPLSAIHEVSTKWWLGLALCDVWVFTDVLTCTASILHLVVIGLDRYWAVTRLSPLPSAAAPSALHPRLRLTVPLVCVAWLAAALVSVPSRFHLHRSEITEMALVAGNGSCSINNASSYTVVANLVSFGLPVLGMAAIYLRVFAFIQRQSRTMQKKTSSGSCSSFTSLSTINRTSATVPYHNSRPQSQSPSLPSTTWSTTGGHPDENGGDFFGESSVNNRVGTDATVASSDYIDRLCLSLNYADEDNRNDDEDEDLGPSRQLITPSSSFRTTISNCSSLANQSSIFSFKQTRHSVTNSNLAEPEYITTSEDDEDPLNAAPSNSQRSRSQLKTPTSIIKHRPSTRQQRIRSPVLSWSPKLTFYPSPAPSSRTCHLQGDLAIPPTPLYSPSTLSASSDQTPTHILQSHDSYQDDHNPNQSDTSTTVKQANNSHHLPDQSEIRKFTNQLSQESEITIRPKLIKYQLTYKETSNHICNQSEQNTPLIGQSNQNYQMLEKSDSVIRKNDSLRYSVLTEASCDTTSSTAHPVVSQHRSRRQGGRREYKVARTLFIITGLFLVCWMPFCINNILRAYVYTSKSSEMLRVLDSIFLWLGYVNSGLNPVVYTIFSPDFRAAFKKILCGNRACCW